MTSVMVYMDKSQHRSLSKHLAHLAWIQCLSLMTCSMLSVWTCSSVLVFSVRYQKRMLGLRRITTLNIARCSAGCLDLQIVLVDVRFSSSWLLFCIICMRPHSTQTAQFSRSLVTMKDRPSKIRINMHIMIAPLSQYDVCFEAESCAMTSGLIMLPSCAFHRAT